MFILESHISDVFRNRDFGQIEARVTLLAKMQAGQPPRRISVRTHVPVRGAAPLRARLVADALPLAEVLERTAGVGRRGPALAA